VTSNETGIAPVDLLVIGGGINGAAIARDAAGRGLSVHLLEQHDLAQHTSSASSKLIHGGLRYLEYYEFRLVREALIERERLLEIAPHIIWPLEFVLPHAKHLRPTWLIRAGLFLYDHLARRRQLPASQLVSFGRHPAGNTLQPTYQRGFTYADCWVEDSRLVVLNAMDAAERGAIIQTRCALKTASAINGLWHAQTDAGPVAARAVVNAAGPWVQSVLTGALGQKTNKTVRLIKGSHIVVPRLHPEDHAFILQNPDGRIVFVIPYERNFSLIGTTDVPFNADPATITISPEEIEYLSKTVSDYFRQPISAEDVVWSYAGVRPLYDDHSSEAKAVTRDYVLDLTHDRVTPPLLSVFGGKITTSRRLAEHALEKLLPALGQPIGRSWTGTAPLPGGDFANFSAYLEEFSRRFPHISQHQTHRLVRAYGTRAERFVITDMGKDLGGGMTEAEITYLSDLEWAVTAEDVLWRRSRMGLHVPAGTDAKIDEFLARNHSA
jgi:glycerol-3-phosphate dehydrogenase